MQSWISVHLSRGSAIEGDIDGSGILDLADVIWTLKLLAGSQGNVAFPGGSDVLQDGRITLAEALHVLEQIARQEGE